jgi:hypothetical protein
MNARLQKPPEWARCFWPRAGTPVCGASFRCGTVSGRPALIVVRAFIPAPEWDPARIGALVFRPQPQLYGRMRFGPVSGSPSRGLSFWSDRVCLPLQICQ